MRQRGVGFISEIELWYDDEENGLENDVICARGRVEDRLQQLESTKVISGKRLVKCCTINQPLPILRQLQGDDGDNHFIHRLHVCVGLLKRDNQEGS